MSSASDREREMITHAIKILEAAGFEVSHGLCRTCRNRSYVYFSKDHKLEICHNCYQEAQARETQTLQTDLHKKMLVGAVVTDFELEVQRHEPTTPKLRRIVLTLPNGTQWVIAFSDLRVRTSLEEIEQYGYGLR